MSKIEAIRSALDIVAEMDLRSFTVRKQGRTTGSNQCPHCGEGSPHSNRLNVFVGTDGAQRYKCMACGKHGDVIDFVMAADGLSQKDAIDMLARKAGISPSSLGKSAQPRPANRPSPVASQAGAQSAVTEINTALGEAIEIIQQSWIDRSTLSYLSRRGLSNETIRHAVDVGMLRALPEDPSLARKVMFETVGKDRLIASGLMRKDSEWPAPAFMPLVGIPPGCSSIQVRRTLPARRPSDPRYVLYGSVRWPFVVRRPGQSDSRSAGRIAIVEGMLDALSLMELEEGKGIDVALGIPGTSSWKPAWILAIAKRMGPDGCLALAFDNNDAGNICAAAISKFIESSRSATGPIKTLRLIPPIQDWNRTLAKRKEEKQ